MRDPNRLDEFYKKLLKLHWFYAFELPIWKFFADFLEQYKRDPFFPEEDEMAKAFEDWATARTQPESNPDNKPGFCTKDWDVILDIHKKTFPDWRFGQFLVNFFGCVTCKKEDMTDQKLLKYLRQFANGEQLHD